MKPDWKQTTQNRIQSSSIPVIPADAGIHNPIFLALTMFSRIFYTLLPAKALT